MLSIFDLPDVYIGKPALFALLILGASMDAYCVYRLGGGRGFRRHK